MKQKHTPKSIFLRTTTVSLLCLFLLSGCGAFPGEVIASQTVQSTADSKEVASAIPTPSTPAPVLDETNPIYKACSELISIEALYDFNPNFAYDTSISPDSGSLGAKAKDKSGVFCSYVNLSNGDRIDVSVAQFSPISISDWTKKIAETSRPTDAYGASPGILGFFSRSNNEGVSQAVQGNTWVAITSNTFFEAVDSVPLMSQVLHSVAN